MKICQIGSHNFYTVDLVNELSVEYDTIALILKDPVKDISKYYNSNVDLIEINKKSVLDLLALVKVIKQIETKVDCFIFHYLNPYFALILALGIINKPIAYFCYGGDIHKSGLRKLLLKKGLHNINMAFSESKMDTNNLMKLFKLNKEKICTVIWYPLDEKFKPESMPNIDDIRLRWGITKDFIIFSPRNLSSHYNHDLLLKGIIESGHSDKIQVIFTGLKGNNPEYPTMLRKFANDNNIDAIFLDRVLNPQEMYELYTASLINVNIPKNDGVPRSIFEGILCGSIPLLSSDVEVYHEFFEDVTNCIFVKSNPSSIAEGIRTVINNPHLTHNIKNNNLKIISEYFDWNKNIKIIFKTLESIQRRK